MFRSKYLCLCLFAVMRLAAQVSNPSTEAIRIGPGVTPPRVLYKVDPEYFPEARADNVQGTVLLQLAIDEKGRPINVTVLSPLGFGLDERAQAAVSTWKFAPGMKNGKPVKILATVEVNFRFPELWFDEKAERRRTSFNVALQTLQQTDANPKAVDRSVKSMQELCRQRFPPAMYMVGVWETAGEHVAKDPNDGLVLIQKAAAKNYGPALYEIALRQIEGRDLPKDPEKGLEIMRQASVLGSPLAQFYLGNRYETGSGVPRELDRARRYFRLCAARGISRCQYRLGILLLDSPDRPERDYVQAVAWLQLASEQGIPEARDIASKEAAKLTPSQTNWMTTLKTQLVRK
ncbi:MAG TPA: TonB family protein [Bryobacteraceae bacterium]|nr:TonB family protein [Bryobacteraceae bacterium]